MAELQILGLFVVLAATTCALCYACSRRAKEEEEEEENEDVERGSGANVQDPHASGAHQCHLCLKTVSRAEWSSGRHRIRCYGEKADLIASLTSPYPTVKCSN